MWTTNQLLYVIENGFLPSASDVWYLNDGSVQQYCMLTTAWRAVMWQCDCCEIYILSFDDCNMSLLSLTAQHIDFFLLLLFSYLHFAALPTGLIFPIGPGVKDDDHSHRTLGHVWNNSCSCYCEKNEDYLFEIFRQINIQSCTVPGESVKLYKLF